jgi:hypothetical protein
MTIVQDERWNVDFSVSKSIRYHAYRRSFWDMLDKWSKVLSVISGTAVVVSVLKDSPFWTAMFAVVVALMSSADLVLGFGESARLHDALYRRFSRLSQDIAENLKPSEEQIAGWRRQRLEIEMDEPGTMDWLERRCAGEECRARGCDMRPAWDLPWWKVAFSQIAFWPAIPTE